MLKVNIAFFVFQYCISVLSLHLKNIFNLSLLIASKKKVLIP